MNNKIRNYKFTSSKIAALVSNGKAKDSVGAPFTTLVKKVNQCRKAQRSIYSDSSSKATSWGILVEHWLMFQHPEIIGLEYTLTPSTSTVHPLFPNSWAGSRDGLNNDTNAVIDIKCPYTMESFCDFADCSNIEDVRNKTKSGEDYYWQLVSNACIHGTDKAELIIFCPTVEQLNEIQVYSMDDEHREYAYYIGTANVDTLPYLPSNAIYDNVIKFAFTIPQSDIDLLTARVKMASELLVELPTVEAAK